MKSLILLILSTSLAFAISNLAPLVRAVKYPTVTINPDKISEDISRGVVKLTSDQREADRIVVQQGSVYTSAGDVFPDTQNSKAKHLGHVNYVMDSDGNFYIFNEYATPLVRHSSILNGGPVTGAGEIVIQSGHIVYIDSDSGHYNTKNNMKYVYQQLAADGVNTVPLQH